jgi:four helix bundle protein
MATISKFEDLDAWKESRTLCQIVRNVTRKVDFSKDFDLVRQIRRSSGSVMDNIAEGFERDGTNELIQFLSIAKASAGEVRSQFYRATDYGYTTEEELNLALEQCVKTSRMISSFIKYLKTTQQKGTKYTNRS